MTERWLLVGVTHEEIKSRNYKVLQDVTYVTLDRGDDCSNCRSINFHGDAFDVQVWKRILSCHGLKSFDVIFTDGGLFGIRRVDEIIDIKYKLLKDNGHIVNYTSPIGQIIRCPFGRPYQYFLIPKQEYTVENMQRALQNLPKTSYQNTLRAGLNILL